MPKSAKPFTTPRRSDSKTFQITLNESCGLPKRVCDEWCRRSFKEFPDDLANYRHPKTKAAAEAAAFALINYLKKKVDEGSARRVTTEDITVGAWAEKFTEIETSPRTGINASKNKPYSLNTLDGYKSHYNTHIKNDPISKLKMAEIEEEDLLEFITRLSVKKFTLIKDGKEVKGNQIGGTPTFAAVISFLRLTFNEYQRKSKRWFNPFQNIPAPQINKNRRDALSENEMLGLFMPGILNTPMELAVCAAIFLSGLRRGELYALRPEDLDWHKEYPKINVCQAWQRFGKKGRTMGPTKGKKVREAPFDLVLQEAIRKVWAENGQHEFVFCHKDGKLIGGNWLKRKFPKWLKDAGIELGNREIVPHSSRHSLASLLEKKGVPLRYIQELLGHSDLKTTLGYLHSTKKTIRDIGIKISESREKKMSQENKVLEFKVS
jgi:integrase